MSPAFEKMIAVMTGGGGALCSTTGLAVNAAKIANPGLKSENVRMLTGHAFRKVVGTARNVLVGRLNAVHQKFSGSLNSCDFRFKGVGGNRSMGTIFNPFLVKKDLHAYKAFKDFFDFVSEGISFVFDLNFAGSLLPGLIFINDRIDRQVTYTINTSFINAFRTLT